MTFSHGRLSQSGNLGRVSKNTKWLWSKLVLRREAHVKDEDLHHLDEEYEGSHHLDDEVEDLDRLDEDDVDRFPRRLAHPVLLAALTACAPRDIF